MGDLFSGALAYADDAVLLARSVYFMSKLLNRCSVFSTEYNVHFNANKLKHMKCGNDYTCPDLYTNKVFIYKVKQFQHLGHTLGQHARVDNFQCYIKPSWQHLCHILLILDTF